MDILAGRIIPLRLGYVPVVNRGQRDIDSKKSISAALDYEREFFENHPSYKGKAQYCGTPFLARKLNMVWTAVFGDWVSNITLVFLDSHAPHPRNSS